MNQSERIKALATAVGRDIKALMLTQGDLSALPTDAKASLSEAIAEIYILAKSGAASVKINDTASTGADGVTWSADKIKSSIDIAINVLKDELTGGAGEALDTFKELQDAIGNDPSFSATLATSLSKRLRVDEAQSLSREERLQACNNLGLGDVETDLLAVYNAAKA